MPRHLRGTTWKTSRMSSCAGTVALAADGARVLVLDLRAAPPRAARTHMQDALQDVERLEAGDDDRHVVPARRSARTPR